MYLIGIFIIACSVGSIYSPAYGCLGFGVGIVFGLMFRVVLSKFPRRR